MKISERPLAFTDVETTGLDPVTHEIVDIGLVVVNPQTLEVEDLFNVKVWPEHPETGTPFALALNGYNPIAWEGALRLPEAMMQYGKKTKDAIFCAHNVTFDWSFIHEAFWRTGAEDNMDYHRIDLFTMAWACLRNSGIEKFNQDALANYLGIDKEPRPHRAINGAMTAYNIYKRLVSE